MIIQIYDVRGKLADECMKEISKRTARDVFGEKTSWYYGKEGRKIYTSILVEVSDNTNSNKIVDFITKISDKNTYYAVRILKDKKAVF